jgi:dihydroflavonol-4-reductase
VIVAERGEPGVRYVLGSENLEWSLVHRTISELCNLHGPHLTANHTMSYLIAVASEVYAAALDREPSVTRDQAAMVGRFYWYRHAPAAQLGYAPRPARQALAEATAWLLASPHLRSIAGAIRPSRELRRARNAVA